MNMSYCQFENTLSAMKQCINSIQDAGSIEDYIKENEPSKYELEAIKQMKDVVAELNELLNEEE